MQPTRTDIRAYSLSGNTVQDSINYTKQRVQNTRTDALQHFNKGGSVVVHTEKQTLVYAKLWGKEGHTTAALTSALMDAKSVLLCSEVQS